LLTLDKKLRPWDGVEYITR